MIPQSPAAIIATFSEPRVMLQVGRERVGQCVSAVGAEEVPLVLWPFHARMTRQ